MKKVCLALGAVAPLLGGITPATVPATLHPASHAALTDADAAKCWDIDTANVWLYSHPGRDPIVKTRKGERFTTSGAPVKEGGKEWYDGYLSSLSPAFGYINGAYLKNEAC